MQSALDQVGTQILDEDGLIVVNRLQDVEPVLEFAKAAHNEGAHGSSEMRHAAEIPFVLVEAYLNRHQISFHDFQTDPAHVRAMLADPALAAFRIWPGKV